MIKFIFCDFLKLRKLLISFKNDLNQFFLNKNQKNIVNLITAQSQQIHNSNKIYPQYFSFVQRNFTRHQYQRNRKKLKMILKFYLLNIDKTTEIFKKKLNIFS